MTVYVTYDDIVKHFTVQDIPENEAGQPDTLYIEECCESVSCLIDGVLRNAGVEFPILPETIQELEYTALSLVRHRYSQRGGVTPAIQKEKDDAMDYLERIRLNQNTLTSIPKKGGLYSIKFSWGG